MTEQEKQAYLKQCEIELLTEVFNRTRENPEKGREFTEVLDAEKKARDRRKQLTKEIFNQK